MEEASQGRRQKTFSFRVVAGSKQIRCSLECDLSPPAKNLWHSAFQSTGSVCRLPTDLRPDVAVAPNDRDAKVGDWPYAIARSKTSSRDPFEEKGWRARWRSRRIHKRRAR